MASTDLEKAEQHAPSSREHAERITPTETHATYIDKENVQNLSEEHKQYLLQRHGTLDLDPIPGFGDADPYNWPSWKVRYTIQAAKIMYLFPSESYEFDPRRIPCHDGYLYSILHSVGLSRHCRKSQSAIAADDIFNLFMHRHLRRSTPILATSSRSIRTTAGLYNLSDLQRRR